MEENKQGQLSGFAGHTQGRQRQVREREQGLVQIVKGVGAGTLNLERDNSCCLRQAGAETSLIASRKAARLCGSASV